MPIYTYKCSKCDSLFEKRQRMADDPLTVCEVCGAEDSVRRVINSVGVVFKGSGFYVTDNRGSSSLTSTKSPDNNGSADKRDGDSGKSDSGAKTESTTESKPAKKTATTNTAE